MIIDYSNLVQGTNRCSSKSSSARLYRVESWHLRCWSAPFRWLGPSPSGGDSALSGGWSAYFRWLGPPPSGVDSALSGGWSAPFRWLGPPPSGGDSALSGHLSNHIQRGVVASLQSGGFWV